MQNHLNNKRLFVFLAVLISTLSIYASAGGGGGGHSGGGSGGGGGDGGAIFYLVYWLIRFIFGLPFPINIIVFAVIIFVIYKLTKKEHTKPIIHLVH